MGEIADYLVQRELERGKRHRMYKDDVVTYIVQKTLLDTKITKDQALRLMWRWFEEEGKKITDVGWKYPKDSNNLRQVLQFTLDFQDHFKDYLRRLDK